MKLEDDKVFHIHVELLDENTKTLIEKSPDPSALEISNLEKMCAIRHLDKCFNNVETFIETMLYGYDNMIVLQLVHTNKMKFKKSEGGNENKCQEQNDRF